MNGTKLWGSILKWRWMCFVCEKCKNCCLKTDCRFNLPEIAVTISFIACTLPEPYHFPIKVKPDNSPRIWMSLCLFIESQEASLHEFQGYNFQGNFHHSLEHSCWKLELPCKESNCHMDTEEATPTWCGESTRRCSETAWRDGAGAQPAPSNPALQVTFHRFLTANTGKTHTWSAQPIPHQIFDPKKPWEMVKYLLLFQVSERFVMQWQMSGPWLRELSASSYSASDSICSFTHLFCTDLQHTALPSEAQRVFPSRSSLTVP